MAIEFAIDYSAATREVHHAAANLARAADDEAIGFAAFRRAWIRDLGRLAREHQADEDWVISAYAVQMIRQLQGRLPIE